MGLCPWDDWISAVILFRKRATEPWALTFLKPGFDGKGGSIAQWLAYLLPNSAAPGLIHNVPKFLDEKIVDGDEINQCRCLEESEQWLENVDWTHLVLASGKLVLSKELFRIQTKNYSVFKQRIIPYANKELSSDDFCQSSIWSPANVISWNLGMLVSVPSWN